MDTGLLNLKLQASGAIPYNKWHGVLARNIGATNPLPVNLTTQVFTLGAAANPITYYYQGAPIAVTADQKAVLDDATGTTTTSGVLVSGHRYVITTFVAGDDFSNLATAIQGVVNTTGFIFTATNTAPTNWTHGSSVRELVSSAGTYYVYFNGITGAILATKTGFGVSYTSDVSIAHVFWNGTDYGLVSDERHGYMRDTVWHYWAHYTIGARYRTGITLSASGTGASAVMATTAGEIEDEDLVFAVPASSAFPTPNSCRIIYQTGAGTYGFVSAPSTIPYKQYNPGSDIRPVYADTANSYTLTPLQNSNTRFVNVFFYAVPDLHTPIIAVVESTNATIMTSSNGYPSTSAARAIPFPSLSGMGLSPEMKPIYRLVISGTGVVQTITAADDYRTVSSLPQSAGTSNPVASSVTAVPYNSNTGTDVQSQLNWLYDNNAAYVSHYFDAAAMVANTTAGAAAGTLESATNKEMTDYFEFVSGADSSVQVKFKMPDGWDLGAVKFKFYWTAPAGSAGDVIWGVSAVAISDTEAIDTAFGTAVTVTDTYAAANDVRVSVATAEVTVGNTPASGDLLWFKFYRNGAAGGDNFASPARLLGVTMQYRRSATPVTVW